VTKQNQIQENISHDPASDAGTTNSRRRFLKVGAALAAAALATTMIDQKESKAALQLGDVQGESDGPDAGVAGINYADGDGVLGVGHDGPAVRGHTRGNGVAVRAESLTSDAVDAFSQHGRGIYASSGDNHAIFGESSESSAIVGRSVTEAGTLGLSTDGPGVMGISENLFGVSGESAVGSGVHGKSYEQYGVLGESVKGVGVYGTSSDDAGVRGESKGSPGVIGTSDEDVGVYGASGAIAGVRGYSGEKIGVEGLAPYGTGVEGYSVTEIGVRGHGYHGIGVLAETNSGAALQVQGRANFETAGNAVIPAGTDTVFVNEPLTMANSHVSVTFMGHPAPSGNRPPAILYVERKPDVGFQVFLTGRVEVDTPISFLVVEPVIHRVSADPVRHG